MNITEQYLNDPTRAGQLASPKFGFGPRYRYCAYAVHTRFDAVQWFCVDAETEDHHGLPEIVGQGYTYEAAVAPVLARN